MRKRRLFTPGPTPVSPAASQAAAQQMIHHRTPEFARLMLATRRNLQEIFKTSNDIVILSASGTAAMEAAVVNMVPNHSKAAVVVIGKFGERWVDLCQVHRRDYVTLKKEYGKAASSDEICQLLGSAPEIDTLFLQGCETSTATMHDLESIGKAVRSKYPSVVIVVDGITAVGSQTVLTDEWGLDMVIGGSQKSFALSPGLAFISLSPLALERLPDKPRSYYLDLTREIENQRQGKTAFTPAVSLIQSLHASTQEIVGQGLDSVIEEARIMAAATRAGLESLGCKLLSNSPANAATAAFAPDGVDTRALIKRLDDRFNLKVAGGQGHLEGRIFRVAHLGYFDLLDVFSLLGAIELVLADLGGQPVTGKALSAALKVAQKESYRK